MNPNVGVIPVEVSPASTERSLRLDGDLQWQGSCRDVDGKRCIETTSFVAEILVCVLLAQKTRSPRPYSLDGVKEDRRFGLVQNDQSKGNPPRLACNPDCFVSDHRQRPLCGTGDEPCLTRGCPSIPNGRNGSDGGADRSDEGKGIVSNPFAHLHKLRPSRSTGQAFCETGAAA